jgi:hypothetical protein
LNERNGGGLGTFGSDLTKEECEKVSSKYISKFEFRKKDYKTYRLICRMKWLDELCSHMINKRRKKDFWTYELCKTESLKYKGKTEFSNGCQSAYKKAVKEGWINEWFSDKRLIRNDSP